MLAHVYRSCTAALATSMLTEEVCPELVLHVCFRPRCCFGQCSQRGSDVLDPALKSTLHAFLRIVIQLPALCPACAVLEHSMVRDVCNMPAAFGVQCICVHCVCNGSKAFLNAYQGSVLARLVHMTTAQGILCAQSCSMYGSVQ